MRRDELHATAIQLCTQFVGVVGGVANETLWSFPNKPLRECDTHKRDLMWRCALQVHRDRKTVPVGYRHDLGPLPALGLADPFASVRGWCKAAVDEGFLEVKVALIVQGFGEDLEYAFQNAVAYPLLKPAMASLIRRVAVGRISPRSACAQHPQNAIENRAPVFPGSTPTILAASRCRNEWRKDISLLVREVTGVTGRPYAHRQKIQLPGW